MEWPTTCGVVVPELLAGGDPEHLAHQVEAGHLLGNRVLDLEPGVDLEEGDGAVLADQELAGAGADVARLAQDRLGRLVEPAHLVVGEERRRRLLDELLVAALEGAVARGDDHDVAVLVGQALGLDVPRLVQVPLDEALAPAERCDGLADRRVEELGDLLLLPRHLEAAAAAAEGRLDGDRQAVLLGEGDRPRRRRRRGHGCRRPAARRPSPRCGGPGPCRRGSRWPTAVARSRPGRRRSRPGRSRRSRRGSHSRGAPSRRPTSPRPR